jgi:glycosyltransferase involved in cell wall biosynthesis
MSMQRPVICTATAGQHDTLREDETGRYVPHADAPAMRAAIDRLLASPDDAARLGSAARAWAIEHADIDVYSRDLATIAASLRR